MDAYLKKVQSEAALKVQTAYRLLRLTYLKFGPNIFCTRLGEQAPYGRLLLTRGVGQQLPASWICAED